MKSYRDRRAEACNLAFQGFEPDFSKCRDKDEAFLILDMAKNGFLSEEIGKRIGKTPKAVQKFFRRYKFPRLSNIVGMPMEQNPSWKGGTKLMKGYLYKRVSTHPNGTKHGNYVAVHRLVVEEKIGRYLLPTEVVDHIDGDITNNHPDNLRVFASNADHLRETLAGRCPAWTEEGKKALDHSRRQPRRTWKGKIIQPTH